MTVFVLAVLFYAAGVVLCVYPFAQAIAWTAPHLRKQGFDAVDWTLAGTAGLLIALLWPLALVGFLVYRASKLVWKGTMLDEAYKVDR